ncbi:hypothetical protein KAR91_80430 [Candidatus Pacearchaeota archaeon]|nr:hypothetical protein [Candidatus Pacearchaeota archaeon]
MMRILKLFKETVHPKTIITGDNRHTYFNTVNKDMQKCENIYRSGGLVSQAIDAYPMFALSNGYELEGAPTKTAEIRAWLDKIDIEQLIWQSIIDAYVYGDSIQENVYGRSGKLLYLVPRNPKYFTIEVDKWGMIESYTQRANNKETVLKPEQVTNLSLISLSGESYGQSLVQRATDDIMRDTKTAESTAVAIERHGYPRFHIKAGSETTKYNDEDKRIIANEFKELKADNEFISNPDLEILPIDTAGVGKIKDYNEWSLSRLLGALGVPSEIIGTGQSTTTYATASVEMVSFYNRVSTIQHKVERCYNAMIDIKTENPGQVVLKLNKVNMDGLANVSPEQKEQEA